MAAPHNSISGPNSVFAKLFARLAVAVHNRMRKETKMTFEALFAREVYIRLAEDRSGFVCTVRRGRFLSKSAVFGVEGRPILALERAEEPLSTRARDRRMLALPRFSRLGTPAD